MTFTGRGRRATGAMRATVALIAGAALVLSGCGDVSTGISARQKAVRSTDSNVKFNNCGASCTGEIDGAK
jgi:S-adenosylhomocysteine hydrolase